MAESIECLKVAGNNLLETVRDFETPDVRVVELMDKIIEVEAELKKDYKW